MRRLIILAAIPSWFTGILDHYGVLAVFLFVTVENFGVPIPGETMLLAASAYAAAGHLNIVLVAVCCIAGVWLGSTLSYLAGRGGGMALLRRLHLPERELGRAQAYLTRWGSHTVLFGRYVAFLRSYIGWLAGISEMAPGPFLFWNLAGAVVWTLTFSALGYVLGRNWALIERIIKALGYGAVALVVVAVIGYLLYRRRRNRRLAAQTRYGDDETREETLVGGKTEP